MREFQIVHIVYLLGWLILAGSALAAYRFSWQRGLKIALLWLAIFGGVFLFFQAVRGG